MHTCILLCHYPYNLMLLCLYLIKDVKECINELVYEKCCQKWVRFLKRLNILGTDKQFRNINRTLILITAVSYLFDVF